MKRALKWGEAGPDLILDDLGIMTEFIHIGIDVENFFEKNQKFPSLEALGWISDQLQAKLSKLFGAKSPSAPPEDTYYAGLI